MPGIMLAGKEIADDLGEDAMQDRLRDHYDHHKGQPPQCLCNDLRPRLYIARFNGRFLLKRWPGSGHEHAVDCDRYEPPLEISGLGHLLGSAIREDTITGDIEVRLGFPLKRQPRAAPATGDPDVETDDAADPSAKTSASKVSLRGILHYLWDQAELSHWKPGMKGKRNWWVVRSRILDAASRMVIKGSRLTRRLFVPEAFKPEAKEDIRLRRRAFLQTVASAKASRELMMFLVEVKDISPSTYGYKLVARNVPDEALFMSAEQYKYLGRRFETELEMFGRQDGSSHLIAFGTLSVKPSGTLTIEDITLMATTAEWIPVADATEAVIIDYAVATGRQFTKPLRYNLASGRALAAIVFVDTREKPAALYVIRPSDSETLIAARNDLMASSLTTAVEWKVDEDPLPTSIIDAISQVRQRFAS